ncbi:BON domain-containing protein [Caulobacter sp. KR2-114]|uniref:BON domain-containing protein n=1 Tax=Caulobacter sp. KR2-114 TaxID=3400912 RepID=UPI003C08D47B
MPDQGPWQDRRPEWDRMGWEDRDRGPRGRHAQERYAQERYAPDSDAYRRDDRFDGARADEARSFGDRGPAGPYDERRFGEGAVNREYRTLGGYPYDDRGPYQGSAEPSAASRYAERMDAYRRAYGARPSSIGATYGGGRGDYDSGRPAPDPREGRGEDDGRSFWAMAGDEVASWFGDRGAERRRTADARHAGRGPKSYKRTDGRIHEDVNDRLTEDPYLDATDIDVLVKDGEVTLNGFILDRGDKRRAEDLAERVSGVQHVQNNLRVRPAGFAGAQDTARSASGEPVSTRVSRISDSDA